VKFVCALFVLWGWLLPCAALDRHAFTFIRYDLNARIEPEQQRLGVRGKITLRNDSDSSQKNLSLQISSSLNWVSIQFESKPVEFVSQSYTSDIDHTGALTEAIVVLLRPILPKQSIELEIGYEGTIPQDATRLTRIGVPADTAKHSDWDQIGSMFTAVRGVGYVAWYPIATEAASLSEGNSVFEEIGRWKQRAAEAQFDVDLCVTRRSSEAAPMIFRNEPPHREGSGGGYDGTVCTGYPYRPLGVLIPIFVAGNYSSLGKSDVEIQYLPEHKSGAEDYALAIEQVAAKISNWFGDHRDKPEFKAAVVDLPDPQASPFESGSMLLMPLAADESTLLLMAARQLTHLYFPSPRTWIGDGLAGYAQANYFLNEKGRDAALVYLENHRGGLVEAEKQNLEREGDRSAESSLINGPDQFFVQAKAMNVWWMLKDIVGDTNLSAALHNYKASDDTSAYYMQKLIEAQSHRDLAWVFDDWVYRDRGLPNLRIVSVYPREMLNGGYLVTVTVENQGAAGAEVPVTVHMAIGESTERLIVPGKSRASVRVLAAAVPQEVMVNDGGVPESETTHHSYQIGTLAK
jgi:hypothetical protein